MTGKPLLHVCHAPADREWVFGRMLPALGLAPEQYRTRIDDALGEPQIAEIERAVGECRLTVLIASGAARWDAVTQFAVRLAQHATLERAVAEHARTRVAVIARDFAPGSEAEQRRLTLAQRMMDAFDCSDEERTRDALARLRRELSLPEPIEPSPVCPYPGLDRFTPETRHLLFGRDRDRDAILGRIHAGDRRILVYGPSGSGKSSLIHAAVLPLLSPADYLVQVVPRGGDLAAALRTAIDRLEVPGAGAACDRCLHELEASDAAVHDAHARWLAPLEPGRRRRVIVIDPLEEIFATDEPGQRVALFRLLGGMWSLAWCTVILCMRADFFGALMSERCWRDLEHHTYSVTSLDEPGLREAIREPALHAGVYVDAALVERLVREVDSDRASVPLSLLQVALEALWERRAWRYLSLESYERIINHDRRGLAAILALHADGVLDALTAPGDRELAQRILLDLVHPGEGRPHTRRRRTLGELGRDGDEPAGQLERVLRALIDGRLVTTGEGGSALHAASHVDLAHDVLITGWDLLASWVKERQSDMLKHRRLEARASEWRESGRTRGLFDEGAVADARAWRDSPGGRALRMSAILVELIAASDAENTRVRREREDLIARLLDEQRKTRESIAAATRVADEIVFQIDRGLEPIAGASRVRRDLLARSRDLLTDLKALGDLDGSAQRTDMATTTAEAELAFDQGRLDEAGRLFIAVHEQASRRAAADPHDTDGQRDLAVACERLGNLAEATGQLAEARRWFEQSLAIDRRLADDDPASTSSQRGLAISFDRLGEVCVAEGKLDEARAWFEQCLAVRERLAADNPDDADWRSDLSRSHTQLGNVAAKAGHVDEAHRWYERGRVIHQALVDLDPTHAGWQRGLSVSCNKIGDVSVSSGQLATARDWYRQGLAIREALADAEPDNDEWQSDLAVSFSKLGDVAMAMGDLAEARRWFEQDLAVSQRLATSQPSHAEWQQDLSVALDRLGDVAAAGGDLDAARAWYEQGRALCSKQAAADPTHTRWRRDLLTFVNKLGDTAMAAGKLAEARTWFEQDVAATEALAATDADNKDWQRDLSISYTRLGDVALSDGQLDDARGWFERSCEVIEALVAADPGNATWRHHLSASYERLGDLAMAAERVDEARRWFARDLAVIEALAAGDPANAEWQRDLSVTHERLGDACAAAGEREAARDWFEQSLAIRRRLSGAAPDNTGWLRDVSVACNKLGDLALAGAALDDAGEWFVQGLAVRRQLAEGHLDNASAQHDLLVSYVRLASVARAGRRLDDARGWLAQALEVGKALAAARDNIGWQRDLGIVYSRLGDIALDDGQLDEARRWLEQDLAMAQALVEASPGNPRWRRDLVTSCRKLAEVADAAGRHDEAGRWRDHAAAAEAAVRSADGAGDPEDPSGRDRPAP